MVARRARSDGQRRQQEILDAALVVFLKRGALLATLGEIRELSGASPSSLYHHFGGRDAIAMALLERTFTRLFAVLDGAVTPHCDAQGSVQALVRAHIDWCLSERDQAAFMYQLTTVGLSDDDRARMLRFKEPLYASLVRHFVPFMQRGEIPQLTPVAFDVLVMGAAHEGCRRALAGAPIDEAWLRRVLPALAWVSLAACRT